MKAALAILCSAVLVACGDDGSSGGGEAGTTAARTSAAAGVTQSCDELPACEGDTTTPASGCVECAVLGDESLARDGGACRDEYVACFGPSGDCTNGHPGCCGFLDCLLACPDDVPATQTNEFLNCVCDNVDGNCVVEQSATTCLGKYGEGGRRYIEWVGCIYLDVCPNVCD